MCNAPWYCANKHWIINLRISAGSRGLLSDTLMSSNKNNDLTRCNCYCNNSWTRRILITGDSDPDATTLLKVRSLLRRAGTCQGPGASHHGLPPGPRGPANIELQRGGRRRGESTQAPEIKLWRRLFVSIQELGCIASKIGKYYLSDFTWPFFSFAYVVKNIL